MNYRQTDKKGKTIWKQFPRKRIFDNRAAKNGYILLLWASYFEKLSKIVFFWNKQNLQKTTFKLYDFNCCNQPNLYFLSTFGQKISFFFVFHVCKSKERFLSQASIMIINLTLSVIVAELLSGFLGFSFFSFFSSLDAQKTGKCQKSFFFRKKEKCGRIYYPWKWGRDLKKSFFLSFYRQDAFAPLFYSLNGLCSRNSSWLLLLLLFLLLLLLLFFVDVDVDSSVLYVLIMLCRADLKKIKVA